MVSKPWVYGWFLWPVTSKTAYLLLSTTFAFVVSLLMESLSLSK
uniref:Uncharacterized protein n=1 Tax=Arundo donax TaxID=35708 RepID=A0A0A9BQM1_ARUDO